MRARGSKTDEAAKKEESNSSQRIDRTEIVRDSDAIIDAVIEAPTQSLTGGDGTFPLPVASGTTMCSVAAGQGAPIINGIPDAMMSPTESSGADGTLPVSLVNRPIRSSLKAGQGPPRIDETSAALSPTRRTPKDPEAGKVPAQGPPTRPEVDFIEFWRIERIDAVIAATDGDGTFPLPVGTDPTMSCSVATGQGAPIINGIPDAMMSPTKSPGADGTLPVSIVNGPIRSSLEAGQGPPRIDETSATLSPTRRTPEDLEAGEVPARVPPTSLDSDFIEYLMETIKIFISFLAIDMALVSVLFPSNKAAKFAVVLLNLIVWGTMLITFVAKRAWQQFVEATTEES